MKKINILLFPFIFLTTLTYAEDKVYSFIGIQTSATKFENASTPTVGIRYGQQTATVRTSLNYDYGKHSKDSYHTLMIEMDTGILTETFAGSQFKPYIGASIGIIQHNNSKGASSTENGYLYGINTGFTYILNNDIDLDLGYKFLQTSKLKNLNNINDLSFAMHYFY